MKKKKKNMAMGIYGGMLPRSIFETLDVVMSILLLLEQLILWQTLFKFFAHNSEFFTKHGTFCLYIFDLCMLKM